MAQTEVVIIFTILFQQGVLSRRLRLAAFRVALSALAVSLSVMSWADEAVPAAELSVNAEQPDVVLNDQTQQTGEPLASATPVEPLDVSTESTPTTESKPGAESTPSLTAEPAVTQPKKPKSAKPKIEPTVSPSDSAPTEDTPAVEAASSDAAFSDDDPGENVALPVAKNVKLDEPSNASNADELALPASAIEMPAEAEVSPLVDESGAELPKAANVKLEEALDVPLKDMVPAKPDPTAAASEVQAPVVDAAVAAEAPVVVEPPIVVAAPAAKPLRLLGAEVLPGTSTRLAWAPKDSLAGISAPTPVLVVHGKEPGPVVCLTAALHGDELNGIEVVRRVMYDLEPEKLRGTVIGVPIVNLQGFRRASRYMLDRRDLNRYFPGRPNGSSAARIAHSFFTKVITHCTVLVDLHTGSFRRTNLPQLRADLNRPEVAELTKKMGAVVVLQSQGARASLRRAATEAGIPSVTIEAGEPLHVGTSAVKAGVMSIEALLHNMDMFPKRGLWARETKPVYYRSRWVRVANGGILKSSIRLGARVKKGQVLGTVIDPITNVSSKIKAPQNAQVIGMALNQIMLPGFAAYHLGFQASVEEAAGEDAGPDEASGDEAETPDDETEAFDEQS